MHVLALVLTLVAADAPPATSKPSTAASLETFRAAWIANDVEKTLALFTDDAVVRWVIDPAPPGRDPLIPDEIYRGKEELRSWLEAVLPGARMEVREEKSVEVRGRQGLPARAMTWSATMSSERSRALGVDASTFAGELVWRGDLFESLRLVASPETSAKLLLAIPQGNKAQVRRFFEQVNRGNAGIVDEILARNFEQHSQMPMAPGREGLKAFYAEMWKAFPGAQFTIEDIIAEGDRVVVRLTARYVHKGEFMGVAPTGKAVEIQKIDIFRFAGGRCVEHWDVVDRLGLLQQLGALPKLPRWSTTPGYEQIR